MILCFCFGIGEGIILGIVALLTALGIIKKKKAPTCFHGNEEEEG